MGRWRLPAVGDSSAIRRSPGSGIPHVPCRRTQDFRNFMWINILPTGSITT